MKCKPKTFYWIQFPQEDRPTIGYHWHHVWSVMDSHIEWEDGTEEFKVICEVQEPPAEALADIRTP